MNKLESKQLIIYVVALIILFASPIITIMINTDTLKDGTEYLFRVETYDPYDMFRGNYLNIRFREDTVRRNTFTNEDSENSFTRECYVTIRNDIDGFAYFDTVSFVKPQNVHDYYKTTGHFYRYSDELRIDTPTRYYMNEDKSQKAEEIYRDNIDDVYVKVRVKDGKMVIVGVYINDILIDTID